MQFLECIVPGNIHTSPAEGFNLPTSLEIPLSFIHFFKCFGLAETPTPRKFQSTVLKWRGPSNQTEKWVK